MKNKVLVICGPTATGKTKFALDLAKEFNGELISADSRQVYKGRDIITGKDLPPESTWVNTKPGHYDLGYTKIWLYDAVSPGEEFSVALWHKLTTQIIEDILSRGKLPIIVGGTGLYIKSLTQNLPDIHIPRNAILRLKLSGKDANYLFNYLNQINSTRARRLNESDQKNPRRLIRVIEIAQSQKDTPFNPERSILNILQIGLTTPKDELIARIKKRVKQRGLDTSFEVKEINIMKKQLTWFKKQPDINWFNISSSKWPLQVRQLVQKWYNNPDAKKG